MVKWRCKASGNIIQLDELETTLMLKHPGYEKVKEEGCLEPNRGTSIGTFSKTSKDGGSNRGRPRRFKTT